jgi:transcriptional regulator with XRE-family HTH domain
VAKGFSQEALADRADLHRTYVSSVERGERNVTLETIEKLAVALSVSMAKLMPD